GDRRLDPRGEPLRPSLAARVRDRTESRRGPSTAGRGRGGRARGSNYGRSTVNVLVVLLIALVLAAPAQGGSPYLDLERGVGGIANQKAFAVGDIVTVLVVETATASTTAKTDANSKSEVSGGPGLGILNQITDWGLDTETKYKGDGKSSRTG